MLAKQTTAAPPPPRSAGDVLDQLLGPGTGAASAGASGSASSGHAAAQAPAPQTQEFQDVKKLVVQVEARTRGLENVNYQAVFMPVEHEAVVEGLAAQKAYYAAADLSPSDHGLGGPEGMTALGFLKGLCLSHPMPQLDPGIQARLACTLLLYASLRELDVHQVGFTIPHFQIGVLDGARKGSAIVVFCIKGRMTLPSADDLNLVQAAGAEAAQHLTDLSPLAKLAVKSFTFDYGEILPRAAPGHEAERVLLGVLCACGGSRSPGRAPPSAQAKRVRGPKKAKAKAKATA